MRIVAISDTHRHHSAVDIPDGDILVHAGDIGCEYGFKMLTQFASWLDTLPHKNKIIIAGNHDLAIEDDQLRTKDILSKYNYLQDEQVIIDGIKFYGSPWSPRFFDWAFNANRGADLKQKWSKIPNNTDVLVTHGPPYKILDYVPSSNEYTGCKELRAKVMEIQPKVHIFGHIHEGYGIQHFNNTWFINASICNECNCVTNKPQIIEL